MVNVKVFAHVHMQPDTEGNTSRLVLYTSLHKNWTPRTLVLWRPETYPTSQLLLKRCRGTGNKHLSLLPIAQELMTLSLPPLLTPPAALPVPRC